MDKLPKGVTRCGLPWRVICVDKVHPDGRNILVLIKKGKEEICCSIYNIRDVIKSQWFINDVYLVGE